MKSKPKKQKVSSPVNSYGSMATHPTETSQVGGEDQRMVDGGYPGVGNEMRSHIGGYLDGYNPNS